ncbi:O-antigen ligase family protein [Dyella acidiphila]|uniref:O-antigen ligase family protein n=1 Tax=Dyella acidiphila TaxID=2775866 RepID=A0ABR9GE58_9GAMM|nr:O-antigen ligase family protein [Dyella acidiphila]MBE1162313.1 O-antigen ligase family protein [Dyella acidiphila]
MKEPIVESPPERPFRLQSDLPKWGYRWLLLGMWWLLVGLAASPVGNKVWNPGKPYHDSLLVLFMAPALWWVLKRHRAFGQRIAQSVDVWLLLVFLAWSSVSSLWANYGHIGDNLFVAVYVLLFVLTWAAVAAGNPQWFRHLLFWGAVGLALSALGAEVTFPWRILHTNMWQEQGRLVSFGSLDNPNLAGFAYGAAIVWLAQTTVRGRWMHALQIVSLLMLAIFVVTTYSRAAWLAVLAAQICMLLTARHGHVKLRALVILAIAALAIGLGGWHYVEQRGMSYRPQIFQQAWDLIRAHPWHGLGMGSHYEIQIGDLNWSHSHNAFTHNAIMLGLPGGLLWVAMWLIVGWRGWLFRHIGTGRCLLALWVFSTVAFQFDAPELMQKPSVEWLMGWLPLAISMGLAWRVQNIRHRRRQEVRA